MVPKAVGGSVQKISEAEMQHSTALRYHDLVSSTTYLYARDMLAWPVVNLMSSIVMLGTRQIYSQIIPVGGHTGVNHRKGVT